MKPIDHLSIVLSDGSNKFIRLFPSMTVKALRRKLEQLGIKDDDLIGTHWHADEEHAEEYKQLVMQVWPTARHVEQPSTEPGVRRVQGRVECRFTINYYRALAKIAFHYFLANDSSGLTGHEPCFAPIRTFIESGGDHKPFFENQKPMISLPIGVLTDGSALLPRNWMHMLCCFESPESIVVAVYTLFGPKRPPSPHFVTIVHGVPAGVIDQRQFGHRYIYGDDNTNNLFVEPIKIGSIEPRLEIAVRRRRRTG